MPKRLIDVGKHDSEYIGKGIMFKHQPLKNDNKSVAYSSQGSHTGQLDFCNWLAAQRDNVISVMLRHLLLSTF